jgi:NADPH-dependent curcumin reductase
MLRSYVNRKVVLAQRPKGTPLDSDFTIVDEPVADLAPGHALVQVDLLGIDAFIRTVLDEGAYHGTASLGAAIVALGVGRVLESTDDALAPGDHVFGPLGAQRFATLPAAALRKLDVSSVEPTAYLGALGLTTGMTAYFGIFEVGAVKPGDTVVVSGAAGAVGSMAGQLAKLAGASKVIGIAGGPEKVAYLTDELHLDAVEARLGELAPNGIDVFYDNVGGDILDAVLMHIVEGSRVVICGAISQYQNMDDVRGPRNYLKLAERHARMEGFAVTHFRARFPAAEAALASWMASGELVMHEHYENGVEDFPAALRLLLSGGHHGKLLLRISEAASH